MDGDKGIDPKDLSVTNHIMNAYRKYDEKMKRFEGREKSHVWGKPKLSTVLFKYLKVRSYRAFFPWQTCKPFACKRNYFVLQTRK